MNYKDGFHHNGKQTIGRDAKTENEYSSPNSSAANGYILLTDW